MSKPKRTTPTPQAANADAVADALLSRETAAADEAEHAATSSCRDAADWLTEPDEPDEPLVHDLIECGENVAVVGQSKTGKSFVALQMGVCVATGMPYLGRETERARVYVANLEVSRKQYKKRLRKLCAALNVTPEDLRGWLFIDNGDENDVNAINEAMAEMKKYQKAGLTTIIVYHSPKGFSGDRQLIDMISGSSTLARFPETIMGLLNHASHDDCRVVKFVLRNYAPPDDATIKFENGMFVPADDIAPVVQTANTHAAQTAKKATEQIAAVVEDVLRKLGQPTPKGALVAKTQDACGEKWGQSATPGEKKIAATVELMVNQGVLRQTGRQHIKGGCILIGLPNQFEGAET